MTNLTLQFKHGDTAPAFRAQLLDDTTPVNLVPAASVRLIVTRGGAVVVDDEMTVEDQDDNPGWVTRDWADDDLETVGDYQAEVEVTWDEGMVQTFPALGFATVRVNPDLGHAES